MGLTGNILVAFTLVLSVFTTDGHCYKSDYGPFKAGESLPLCETHPLSIATQTVSDDPMSPRTYEVMDQGKQITIGVFYNEDQGHAADLFYGENDDEMIPPFIIGGNPFTFVGVYWAYLNDDERKDFIIMTGVDGAGLAASSGTVTFILSSSKGYTIVQSSTWEPRQSELVLIEGKCQYVHTTFVEGVLSKDGRDHNYWHYNLFSFQGDNLVLANQLDERFPKWVFYTWEPNHVETSYISREQKEALGTY